ncbi:MAG: hypothetical protein H7Y15_02935 [Pseudonocardia sp.]|nr:hypothetical protein [Pseudonocardia sp.]
MRFRDQVFVELTFHDVRSRGQVLPELRARIEDCTGDVPPIFTDVRFSTTTLPTADEYVGHVGNRPQDPEYPGFLTQVIGCDIARIDAVLIRVCRLTSNDSAELGLAPVTGEDAELAAWNRALVEPLIAAAREQQAPS